MIRSSLTVAIVPDFWEYDGIVGKDNCPWEWLILYASGRLGWELEKCDHLPIGF